MSCCNKHRDHLAVQVAPGRVAVQAQPGQRRITRALVEVVHAQPRQRRQVGQVVRLPGVTGQVLEAAVRGPERVLTQCGGVHTFVLTAVGKKILQQGGALAPQYPTLHGGLVVQPGLGEQVEHRAGGPGLGVACCVHHAGQARVQHGSGAHRTGLECHVQRAAVEPVVAQGLGRSAQRDDLGVRARVVQRHRLVEAAGDHPPFAHHDRSDRNLARGAGHARLLQGQPHQRCVLGQRLTGPRHALCQSGPSTPRARARFRRLARRQRAGAGATRVGAG